MHSRGVLIFVPMLLLASGCPDKPLPGDEADSTADETGSATDTADTATDTSEVCEDKPFGEFMSFTVAIDNVAVEPGDDIDLDRACTVFDDGSSATLTLSCGDVGFAVTVSGEPSSAIIDMVGASVRMRYLQVSSWNFASQWLRLDFVGEDLSVFLIDAEPLVPSSGWINPWGLVVGQECLADSSIDQYAQSLTLEREGQTLELWQGESGQLGADLQVWVDRSLRDGPNAPPGDGPTAWKELAIVSRGHLASDEVCDPAADACGPGLACCYPCGIPECDYVCQTEIPATMECPPPPP